MPNKVADGLPSLGEIPGTCSICSQANMPRNSFPSKSDTRATSLLERVHMDIAGQLNIGVGNFQYYFLIIDDYSRYSTIYPLKTRDEALKCFKEFQQTAENMHNTRIKRIRCDNAPEFVKGAFQDHAKACGIEYETTVPHTPEQNGVAERHNLTFGNMLRAMLLDADMSDWFWPLAIQMAVHIKNRVPHKALPPHTSPYERWYQTKPSFSRLRPFGAPCIAKILPASSLTKLEPRAEQGRFVGYSKTSKGFLFWHPQSRSIKVRRDDEVDFRPSVGPKIGQGGITDYTPLQALWRSEQGPDLFTTRNPDNVSTYVTVPCTLYQVR